MSTGPHRRVSVSLNGIGTEGRARGAVEAATLTRKGNYAQRKRADSRERTEGQGGVVEIGLSVFVSCCG